MELNRWRHPLSYHGAGRLIFVRRRTPAQIVSSFLRAVISALSHHGPR
jgi:hypothetical protein